MSAISDTLATRAHELRMARKMTLQEVADSVGCARSWVWEIENGKAARPTVDMAARLARCFGVSLDYLTGLSTQTANLHPEAMRIACEIDALLRRKEALCDPERVAAASSLSPPEGEER